MEQGPAVTMYEAVGKVFFKQLELVAVEIQHD